MWASSLAATGCSLLHLWEDARSFEGEALVVGHVDPSDGEPSVVVAACAAGGSKVRLVRAAQVQEDGSYRLALPPGVYRLYAFFETESVPRGAEPVSLSGGEVKLASEIALAQATVAPDGFDHRCVPASYVKVGFDDRRVDAIASLDDPRFSPDRGRDGYWESNRYFLEFGARIYLTEPYDPDRIPVLFVHGATGSPQDWRYFIEHLDRSRYQAWFFSYPSGQHLATVAALLSWELEALQRRHRFPTVYVVAHSMGGLVVRDALLEHGSQLPVSLFVSLSTPWGGDDAADLANHAPAVVPSWIDMQPRGPFLRSLLTRPLPQGVDYYLLFSYRGAPGLLRPNNDGTVSLASQLQSVVQAEARRVYGFDDDHGGILSSPQAFAQFAEILRIGHSRNGASVMSTPAPQSASAADVTPKSLR